MHRIGPFRLAALVFLAGLPPVLADEPQRRHDITVEDYFTQADIFQVAASPDGKYVAYAEGRWQRSTGDRKADLWLVECATGNVRRLTSDRAGDRAVVWAPDGRSLYFLGNRKRAGEKQPPYNGTSQVWRAGVSGGEPSAVTRVEGGVDHFDLARNSRSLCYATSAPKKAGDWQALRSKFTDIHYNYGATKVSQVWKLDLVNWRADKLTDGRRFVHDLALSPDGRRLALITAPDDLVVSFEGRSRVEVCDTRDHQTTALPDQVYRADAPSPYGWLEKLAWSADSRRLAFNLIFDGYPAEVIVAEWTDSGPVLFKLPRPEGVSVRGYGTPLQWSGDGPDLCFLGEERARVRLYRAAGVGPDRKPRFEVLGPADAVVDSFSLPCSGDQAAVLLNDTTHLPDVFLVRAEGRPRRLTRVNPQADAWKLPQVSVVSWKGARGDRVEGVLELPPDYKPGRRLPLVVELHGGPTTATHCHLQFWIYGRTLLPAKGYALLSPNYRGSTGYGDKFITDLNGHENGIEVEDILKGVDALVERGIADPDRLGVMGWSNGGYLTNCLISTTTRFKAAISGAGIVDAVMEFGANDEPAYSIALKQGFPWSRPENYHRASPTYRLDKVRTPTLIHVGGNDERCPPSHSRMLYRVLREYNRVPTHLLVYPGEEHGIMKYKSRQAKMEWDLAWLERYLLGKKEADKDAK